MDYRRTGLIVAASHLVRSLFSSDTTRELSLEITLFRAEVTRAQATLHKTTVVLEHCTSYSNFLTYILKLVALSELVLLVWILYLVVTRHVGAPRQLTLQDRVTPGSDSSSSRDQTPSSTSLVRRGPTRPSDLKKLR